MLVCLMPLSTIFQLYHDMSVLLVEETGVSRENYQTAVTGLEVFGKHQKLAHYYFNFYHFFPKFYKSEEKIKKLNIAGKRIH